MGNRLSAIVTRTGDSGETGLADGSRVPKNSSRVTCLGEIDELNAAIGIVLSIVEDAAVQQILFSIQHDLFDIGAELCQPGKTLIKVIYVEELESTANQLNQSLPPLKEFILPGGSPVVAQLQMARTICRRAERSLVAFSETDSLNPVTASYINRLSDLLFILGRSVAQQECGSEVYWNSRYSRMNRP